MEQKILETINFEVYGIEPMTFIRRYLKAAQLGQNMMVYELSILFMDAMVLRLWADMKNASTAKKESISYPDLKFVFILAFKLIYSDKATKFEKNMLQFYFFQIFVALSE